MSVYFNLNIDMVLILNARCCRDVYVYVVLDELEWMRIVGQSSHSFHQPKTIKAAAVTETFETLTDQLRVVEPLFDRSVLVVLWLLCVI